VATPPYGEVGLDPTDERQQPMDDVRASFARAGLVRSRSRLLGGVCAGLGQRLGLEPVMSRVLFVLLLLTIPGSQLLVYPVLWFCMPLEGEFAPLSEAAAGS
jgi:phage shock protein PspC (stress-responsive transcriptional regulator)